MATTPIPTRPPGEPPSPIQTSPNFVQFDPKLVTPSDTLYFQRNDQIYVVFFTNGVNVTCIFKYRWLTPQGEIKEGEFFTPAFTNLTFAGLPLYEGWLLSISARATNPPGPGQWVFIQAEIARGQGVALAVPIYGVFWQGYLSAVVDNGWPGTPAKEITDGPGILRSITGATPAAGAEITETVPVQRRWSLLSFRATLTTGVTVANRFPAIFIDDGANTVFGSRTNTAQVASTAVNYNSAAGSQFYNDTQNELILPLPTPMSLKGSFRIRTGTAGLQATDQWGAPQYLIYEWGQWDT